MKTTSHQFIVVGGRNRPGSLGKPEWTQYDLAVALRVDVAGSTSETLIEYVTPREVSAPPDKRAVLFKAATLAGDRLYLCTQTEILVYTVPDIELVRYLSLPCFNDLHHVRPIDNGNILVVVTGLDLVLEIDPSDRIVNEWVTAEDSGWARFDRDEDYRLWSTTKPHLSHPNYVFALQGDYWVTRFEQRDALCLKENGPVMPIGVQRPHDGEVFDGRVYFTTVDGHIVVVDANEHDRAEVFDLNEIEGVDYSLGWCRGLHVVNQGKVVVGFSRIRPTKLQENIRWVRHKLGSKTSGLRPSRIAQYDLDNRALDWEYVLEDDGLNAIFSIHPANWPAS